MEGRWDPVTGGRSQWKDTEEGKKKHLGFKRGSGGSEDDCFCVSGGKEEVRYSIWRIGKAKGHRKRKRIQG